MVDRAARWLLMATLFATMTVVDVRAEGAFDAPKRLALVCGIAGASLLVAFSGSLRWGRPRGTSLWIAMATVVAVGISAFSAMISPHRGVAVEALGIAGVLLVGAIISASSIFDGRWAQVMNVFLAGALVNALVALAQRGGLKLFAVEEIGGRSEASAFWGNDGQLAIIAALSLIIVAARALAGNRRTGLVMAVPLLAVVAMTRNVTSILILVAGVVVLVMSRLSRKRAAALALACVVLALAGAGALIARGRTPTGGIDVAAIDRTLTYRLAPWASAVEMVVARPALGFGPGSFSVESTAHRTKAEARWHRRLQNPFLPSGAFGEAHNEFLQISAEAGLPAMAALLVALSLLVVGLLRSDDDREEAALVAAVLVGLGVAALTWFPGQVAATSFLGVLCVGRGWRLLTRRETAVGPRSRLARLGPAIPAAILLVVIAPHEIRRYAAERALYRATAVAKAIASGANPQASAGVLRRLADEAEAIESALPGDRRPRVLRGAAHLLSGNREAALAGYRAALETGESAEVDLNIGRALRTGPEARNALVRAVWLSDAIAPSIPAAVRQSILDDAAERARELEAGNVGAIPPAPRR